EDPDAVDRSNLPEQSGGRGAEEEDRARCAAGSGGDPDEAEPLVTSSDRELEPVADPCPGPGGQGRVDHHLARPPRSAALAEPEGGELRRDPAVPGRLDTDRDRPVIANDRDRERDVRNDSRDPGERPKSRAKARVEPDPLRERVVAIILAADHH